jgi:hypothetical protein
VTLFEPHGKLLYTIWGPNCPIAAIYLHSIYESLDEDGNLEATKANMVAEFAGGEIALLQRVDYFGGESITLGMDDYQALLDTYMQGGGPAAMTPGGGGGGYIDDPVDPGQGEGSNDGDSLVIDYVDGEGGIRIEILNEAGLTVDQVSLDWGTLFALVGICGPDDPPTPITGTQIANGLKACGEFFGISWLEGMEDYYRRKDILITFLCDSVASTVNVNRDAWYASQFPIGQDAKWYSLIM